MRAHEFICEVKSSKKEGKLPDDMANAMPGVHKTRDPGGIDRLYHMNRMGMAMAASDGRSTAAPKDVDAAGWTQKYNTIHPFTKEEDNMVKQAMKVVPTDYKPTVSDRRSIEADDTHRVSPVSGFKGWGKK